ncbi:MAG: dual specificity protein phosphatase family protein [Bryobacterales bacterium]|nr:dual specificity protein phosphatase family protein [Bryobacterales bacterium]
MGYFHRLTSPENLRRLAWLAFLGPFFFLSYNLANGMAAAKEPDVPSIVFAWERFIPFLAWTIVPYWSSDLLYVASFWTCRTRTEIDRLGLRLVAIQVISVCFFVLFPLKLTLIRPLLHGFNAYFFQTLVSFDLPYNQAPSLHVSLAYILWRQLRGPFWGAWFGLIALSALTTYQHHFIDIPTGLWAGVMVVALLPESQKPECSHPRLAFWYGIVAAGLVWLAFGFSWWILLWPGFSFSMVAAAYWTGNVELLGKTGHFPPVWMWPYGALAWINSLAWRSGTSVVADGVAVGRPELWGYGSVVDLTAELPVRADAHVPMLDLALPSMAQITAAVEAIEGLIGRRPTLVCCALGYSRSAAAVAAWLVATGRAGSVENAVGIVRKARPQVVLSLAMVERLERWAIARGEGERR